MTGILNKLNNLSLIVFSENNKYSINSSFMLKNDNEVKYVVYLDKDSLI